MQGVVLCSRRVCHVQHLFHQRQRGLLGCHPCLRATIQRLHLAEYLLAVCIVHLRKLWGEDGVHLVLVILMRNLHVCKWQESGREILCCGKSALARVGVEEHFVALWTVIVGKQPFADYPLAEELSHLRLQHTATQRQLTAWR